MTEDRFRFDPALEAALAHDPVPELPAGFADRIMAATRDRAPPLPAQTRRTRPASASRWRSTRRLAVGTAAFVTLAGAAAASGLLGDMPLSIPSAGAVWGAITGDTAAQSAPASAPAPVVSPEVPLTIEDILNRPIRNIDELEQTYRKIDELRGERSDQRRERVDARISEALERRRAMGLPAPSVEEERKLLQRIGRLRDGADNVVARNVEERREGQRAPVEQGETLTGKDLVKDALQDVGKNAPPPVQNQLDRMRKLNPEQRQERLRAIRERLLDRTAPAQAPADQETAIDSAPETQADEPPSEKI